MQMTDNEIVADYKLAKKPISQIQVLADLNQCTKREIEEILRKHGVVVSKNGGKRSSFDQAEALRLYEQGLTAPEIAPLVGTTRAAIYGWLSRRGLICNQEKPELAPTAIAQIEAQVNPKASVHQSALSSNAASSTWKSQVIGLLEYVTQDASSEVRSAISTIIGHIIKKVAIDDTSIGDTQNNSTNSITMGGTCQ